TIGWPDVESTTAAYKISAVNAVEGSKYPLLPLTALTEPASAGAWKINGQSAVRPPAVALMPN
ncbi:hypothetical protein, partial [Nocardia sp. NPDC004711]